MVDQYIAKGFRDKMVQMIGKYEFESSENFDLLMAASGLPSTVTKPIKKSKPTLEISQEDDRWIIVVDDNGNISRCVFRLDESYEERLPFYENTLESISTMDGNKLITISRLPNDVKFTRVYEFNDADLQVLVMFSTCNVKATRYYKRA